MKKLVIGMIGKAGAGKDTVGDFLVNRFNFVKMALADPLKAGVKATFMLDDLTAYDREEREKPLKDFPEWSARKLYQFVGTELYRTHFDNDIWVKLLLKRIRESECNQIVCCDVRFPNEYDGLKKCNDIDFKVIKVTRDGYDGRNVGLQNHPSEMHDLPFDIEVKNDGNIEHLQYKVARSLGFFI